MLRSPQLQLVGGTAVQAAQPEKAEASGDLLALVDQAARNLAEHVRRFVLQAMADAELAGIEVTDVQAQAHRREFPKLIQSRLMDVAVAHDRLGAALSAAYPQRAPVLPLMAR